MHELSPSEFHQARALFRNAGQSQAFVDAVFAGDHQGRIFVDDAARPAAVLLYCACEFIFLAGQPGSAAFEQAIQPLILDELVPYTVHLFVLPLSDVWKTPVKRMFADYFQLDITRKVFQLDRDRFAQQGDWMERIPAGFSVRRMDRELAGQVEGIEAYWGSLERFLERGYGFCVMDGERIASRCHTLLRGEDAVEISVFTEEPYRRRGLAQLACRAFLQHSLDRGLNPIWSCWFNNEASIALAQKLGYSGEGEVPVCYAYLQK